MPIRPFFCARIWCTEEICLQRQHRPFHVDENMGSRFTPEDFCAILALQAMKPSIEFNYAVREVHNMDLQFDVRDEKRIRVILDTDAACEADDPFAIAHAVLSPKLIVKGIVAEHFAQPGSMRRSYDAVRRLMNAMHRMENVMYGEEYPLDREGPLSEGAAFMIEEALREDRHPLFILCLGALSNIARALKAAPDIANKITIVTIGGHSYDITEAPFREFNFGNDPEAANAVLGSKAEVWQSPSSVYGSMLVGLAELQRRVMPCGEAGKYLFEQMVAYNNTDQASWTCGESWSLGDSPAVGVTLTPQCGRSHRARIKHVNPDTTYTDIPDGRFIKFFDSIDARYILEDFCSKLEAST